MNNTIDLLVIGNLAFDKISSGNKTNTVTGGAAFYSSIGASFFNQRVGVVSRIGEDYPLDTFRKKEISIAGIKVLSDKNSDIFYCTSVVSNETNCFVGDNIDAGAGICFEDIPADFMDVKYIHVATMNPLQQLGILKKLKNSSKAKISIDTCQDYIIQDRKSLEEAIKLSDIVFLNDLEQELLNVNNKDIVIKKGKLGAVAIIGGREYSADAPAVEVIDTIGCGDILAGAFLGQMCTGVKIGKALQNAVNLASNKARDYGARYLLMEEQR